MLIDSQSSEHSLTNDLSSTQNIWHGNIETSTDTLVPIEQHSNNSMISNSTQTTSNNEYAKYITDDIIISDEVSILFIFLENLQINAIKIK